MKKQGYNFLIFNHWQQSFFLTSVFNDKNSNFISSFYLICYDHANNCYVSTEQTMQSLGFRSLLAALSASESWKMGKTRMRELFRAKSQGQLLQGEGNFSPLFTAAKVTQRISKIQPRLLVKLNKKHGAQGEL